jgi:hypothetical protein
MKTTPSIQQIEQRIQRIKTQLAALGEMRPGSLSKQYNVCGKPGCRCKDPEHPQRHGPYYQLSWVHQGKSTTQFIRRPFVAQVKAELATFKTFVAQVKAELATFKTFRRLTEQWVAFALQAAKLRLEAAKVAAKSTSK